MLPKTFPVHSLFPHITKLQEYFFHDLPTRRVFLAGQLPEQKVGLRLGIVGSRRSTEYGRRFVSELLRGLRSSSVCVVSGGAVGIDVCAHQNAMKNSLATRAWLVGPVEKPGPAINSATFSQIQKADGSSLLTPDYLQPDFHLGRCDPPLGKNSWLARNAWIAADSDVLLVIEAHERSGTLHTARMAAEFSKPVFLLPGSVFNKSSYGTHRMISQSYGSIVENLDALTESLVAHATRNSL